MQTGTASHIDETHHSETKNAETKTLETSSTATSRSSSSVKCEEKREDVVKQQFSVSGRVSTYSTTAATAAAATASSSSSQLRRRLEAFSLRQNSATECTSDSFRRSVETTNENFVQYSEEYQDFSKLVDENDFRGSSVSTDSGSSTLSDSRILRVTRSESGSPVISKRKVLLTSASIDEVGQLTQTPLRIRLGSAAVQRATESCPNSPLAVKIKENSATGGSGKSSAWSSGFFSSKAAIEEQAEELLNSSTETAVAMEEQEEKSFHRIKALSTEASSSSSSSISTSSQSVLKTVNVSFGEHVNVKEGSIQRQQTMAEHRQQQRVVLTDSVSSSREGTPTRVPFERSVSAVAAVKRTDSGRSSSGLSVSQREILVNRSRSWNAIEANLFTSSGGGVGSLDHTILAEANGLIADMLMDHGIPPNIASGLKALQILLCPSQQNKSTKVAVGQKVELAPLSEPGDIDDCEEIPFTGEKPSDMSKTRRQLPRSLLRRMSTSTWSTTTSATGMPTLEPEPSRKRSTGARGSISSRPDELLSTTPVPDDLIRANERLVSESSDVCAAHIDFICKYCGRRNSNTRKTSDPIVAKENDTRNFDAKILSPGIYEVNGITLDTTDIVKDAHLSTLCDWDFDIFQLTDQSPKTLLSTMCYRILFDTGLVEAFHIPERELLCYLHALECGYRDIPYHNKMHAADVLHGVYYLTTQQVAGLEQTTISDLNFALEYQHEQEDENALAYGIIASNLPPLELLALYVAAAMHDFEHPGRTNAFIVATHAPLAVLYNDRSVLENHHAAAAWGLLLSKPEFNFLKNLETAEFKRLRYVAIECILATDLKRHFEVLAEFTAKTNLEESSGINWNDEADRLLVLEMAIKLSDINGPCKRHDLHVRWTERICEEFYEQGDEEAHLGLPISPFMDRSKPQLPKLQESFINHLVAPLCNAYAVAGLLPGKWVVTAVEATNGESASSTGNHPNASMDLKDGVKASANNRVECIQIKHLQDNYAHWIKVIQEEKAKEAEAAS